MTQLCKEIEIFVDSFLYIDKELFNKMLIIVHYTAMQLMLRVLK